MKWAVLTAALVLVLSSETSAAGETATLRVAQSSLAVIDVPTRIDTDQETVDFTGRAMKGMVYVSAEGVESDADLEAWLSRGIAFAGSLPAK